MLVSLISVDFPAVFPDCASCWVAMTLSNPSCWGRCTGSMQRRRKGTAMSREEEGELMSVSWEQFRDPEMRNAPHLRGQNVQ